MVPSAQHFTGDSLTTPPTLHRGSYSQPPFGCSGARRRFTVLQSSSSRFVHVAVVGIARSTWKDRDLCYLLPHYHVKCYIFASSFLSGNGTPFPIINLFPFFLRLIRTRLREASLSLDIWISSISNHRLFLRKESLCYSLLLT